MSYSQRWAVSLPKKNPCYVMMGRIKCCLITDLPLCPTLKKAKGAGIVARRNDVVCFSEVEISGLLAINKLSVCYPLL